MCVNTDPITSASLKNPPTPDPLAARQAAQSTPEIHRRKVIGAPEPDARSVQAGGSSLHEGLPPFDSAETLRHPNLKAACPPCHRAAIRCNESGDLITLAPDQQAAGGVEPVIELPRHPADGVGVMPHGIAGECLGLPPQAIDQAGGGMDDHVQTTSLE